MKSIIELAIATQLIDHRDTEESLPADFAQSLREFATAIRDATLEEAAKKRAKPPRNLPRRGTGALLAEQQYCYELGYREGATAVRAAIRQLKDKT